MHYTGGIDSPRAACSMLRRTVSSVGNCTYFIKRKEVRTMPVTKVWTAMQVIKYMEEAGFTDKEVLAALKEMKGGKKDGKG